MIMKVPPLIMTACVPLKIPICCSPAPLGGGGEVMLGTRLLLADGVTDGWGTIRCLKNEQSICRKCRKFILIRGYTPFNFPDFYTLVPHSNMEKQFNSDYKKTSPTLSLFHIWTSGLSGNTSIQACQSLQSPSQSFLDLNINMCNVVYQLSPNKDELLTQAPLTLQASHSSIHCAHQSGT